MLLVPRIVADVRESLHLESAQYIIDGGAKKVVISALLKMQPMFVMGVNH